MPSSSLDVLSASNQVPLHRALYDLSRRLVCHGLPTFAVWQKKGKPVGKYAGNVPTYELKLDYGRCEEFGSQVHMINDAMEKCFGQKGYSGWSLWITGDHMVDLCRDLKREYERLSGLPEESKNLPLLDLWLEKLVAELESCSTASPPSTPEPSNAASGGLTISLISMETGSPRRSGRQRMPKRKSNRARPRPISILLSSSLYQLLCPSIYHSSLPINTPPQHTQDPKGLTSPATPQQCGDAS